MAPEVSPQPALAINWNWDALHGVSSFHRSLGAAVARQVPRGARVLEIGVGPAYALTTLALERQTRGIGIDLDPSAFPAARKTAHPQGVDLPLVRGSAFELPFGSGSYDAVVSLGLIEHYEPAAIMALLREHVRVCRRGGLVIVSVPNAFDLVHTAYRAVLGRRYPYWPERSFTPGALTRLLTRVGLEPVARDGYAPLWSLRHPKVAYPLVAFLEKLGLLSRLSRVRSPRVLSVMGNMTLATGRKTHAD